ncbi:sucrose phosphorylase [Opitutales bacterium ASA1]|uniref:sucrose phosphorylase n=1 Tax=Congregicoccus parvus TaxID=3081749 RepID=UPI002B27DFB7|nr:sucrose phosphorylase [Opitutales bacterium ASA1]
MKNQVQLIAYVDRFGGGGFRELAELLRGPLQGLFGGVHALPFFDPIDGADAGFDPIDHTMVDPRLGDWGDVQALGGEVEVMADLIVNHVSSESPQFRDFARLGSGSAWAGLFLTLDRVFPGGATEGDLLRIYRPRPGLPFTAASLECGERRLLWTTFTPKQVDIDVLHPQGRAYLAGILEQFERAGIRMIRLDAAGYAIKKAGTSCFMIPETYAFIEELSEQARQRGIEVLVEIHSHYRQQVEIAKRVDRVYDFALPPLVLHGLIRGRAEHLAAWLRIAPRNCITVLDTHDGIGVIDVGADPADPEGRPGLLPPAEIDALVEAIHHNSGGQSRRATGAAASNLDLYQVNCTFYDALGRDDRAYLLARAIQFFAPGIPQVYYVGLLAGSNDMELLARTGVGRDVNRRHYARAEIERELERPVASGLVALIRFRNTHPAFAGEFSVEAGDGGLLVLEWRSREAWARLDVDLCSRRGCIRSSDAPTAWDFLSSAGEASPGFGGAG